ncbi:DNA ligase [Vibrio sp. V39_P1S14PM300]|uniref:DNA ligase n=1 Tax=Vibrio sp. V39_P1S14PM300 TaxID=1938690 RepID=UPI001372B0C3|nr:DNA ligase [Vibrio sp. V39_P1S14PM300]NAX20689.1 DNA ligase [Vibrio sp. V39_P1S14PM300]
MELKLTSIAIALLMTHSPESFAQEALYSIPVVNAEMYQPDIDINQYWQSEKLDGIRVIWNGTHLTTRQGNLIHAPKWFVSSLPGYPVEGELWAGRGQFALVQHTVLDKEPNDVAWKQITYMLFDLPMASGNYPKRYAALKTLVTQIDSEHVKYVEHSPITSEQSLFDYLDEVSDSDGEGVMLRKITADYQAGRSSDLLKLKKYQDTEAVIVGYKAGSGKYQGMLGSLRVKLQDGTEFYIGSGLSDQLRKHPPQIGSTITFRHNGYTHLGVPRFARFLREREHY